MPTNAGTPGAESQRPPARSNSNRLAAESWSGPGDLVERSGLWGDSTQSSGQPPTVSTSHTTRLGTCVPADQRPYIQCRVISRLLCVGPLNAHWEYRAERCHCVPQGAHGLGHQIDKQTGTCNVVCGEHKTTVCDTHTNHGGGRQGQRRGGGQVSRKE